MQHPAISKSELKMPIYLQRLSRALGNVCIEARVGHVADDVTGTGGHDGDQLINLCANNRYCLFSMQMIFLTLFQHYFILNNNNYT